MDAVYILAILGLTVYSWCQTRQIALLWFTLECIETTYRGRTTSQHRRLDYIEEHIGDQAETYPNN